MPIPDKNNPTAPGLAGQVRPASLGAVESENLLKADPNYPFFLIHYPENWEVGTHGLDGPHWLPILDWSPVVPGVNGVRTLRQGEAPESAYDRSHLNIQRQGGTVLQQSLGYLCELDCKSPMSGRAGKVYLDKWSTPLPPRPGKKVKFKRDQAAYNQFRFSLVADGVIKAPDPRVIDERVARSEYHVSRNEGKVQLPEDVRNKLTKKAQKKAATVKAAKLPKKGAKPKARKAAPKKPPKPAGAANA